MGLDPRLDTALSVMFGRDARDIVRTLPNAVDPPYLFAACLRLCSSRAFNLVNSSDMIAKIQGVADLIRMASSHEEKQDMIYLTPSLAILAILWIRNGRVRPVSEIDRFTQDPAFPRFVSSILVDHVHFTGLEGGEHISAEIEGIPTFLEPGTLDLLSWSRTAMSPDGRETIEAYFATLVKKLAKKGVTQGLTQGERLHIELWWPLYLRNTDYADLDLIRKMVGLKQLPLHTRVVSYDALVHRVMEAGEIPKVVDMKHLAPIANIILAREGYLQSPLD